LSLLCLHFAMGSIHVQRGSLSVQSLEMKNRFCCWKKHASDIISTCLSELPARSVDLSALNLTELVNGMLSRGLKGNDCVSAVWAHSSPVPACLLDYLWPGQDSILLCLHVQGRENIVLPNPGTRRFASHHSKHFACVCIQNHS
jgi:hypothetical protein